MQAQQLSSIMLPIFFILSFALVAGTDATPLPAMEGDTIDVIFKPPRLRAVVGAQRGARARQRMRVNPPQVLLQEMVNENHGESLSKLCLLQLCLRLERINAFAFCVEPICSHHAASCRSTSHFMHVTCDVESICPSS